MMVAISATLMPRATLVRLRQQASFVTDQGDSDTEIAIPRMGVKMEELCAGARAVFWILVAVFATSLAHVIAQCCLFLPQ